MDRFTTIGSAASTFQPSLTKTTGPPKQVLDKDDFLKLFLTQLRNQDPEKAQDQSQMMAQMAQFTQLEQITNLNKTMTAQSATEQLASASNLIGRAVQVLDTDGNSAIGLVSSVRVEKGEARIMIDGKGYKMSEVVTVQ